MGDIKEDTRGLDSDSGPHGTPRRAPQRATVLKEGGYGAT